MTKLTNKTILEFKLTETGKNHIRGRLLSQRSVFESLLYNSCDYPKTVYITGAQPKEENIENIEYLNAIDYIDKLFRKIDEDKMTMTFLDFLSIFPGVDSRYIVDGDVTILEHN